VDRHVVREILGHTSIKTTERYAHVMVQPQRRALAKLGRLREDLHRQSKRRPKAPLSI
jgi:integrase